jgi:hypothetical protein
MKFSFSPKLRNKILNFIYKYLKKLLLCYRLINYRFIKSKLRNLSLTKIIILSFFSVCFYFLYKYIFPYDLMKIVLEEQKIYRFKVTCNISSLIKHYHVLIDNKTLPKELKQFKDVSKITGLKKLEILQKYYYVSHANLVNKNILYDLKLENNNYSFENEKTIAMNNFKICFFSPKKRLGRKSPDEKELQMLYKKNLNDNDIKLLNLHEFNQILNGGYFKPSYCVQDLLLYAVSSKSKINLDIKIKSNNALTIISEKFSELNNKEFHNMNDFITEVSAASAMTVSELINDNNFISDYTKEKEKFTAIIITFLKRDKNLIELLLNLHSFLQRQFIHYKIFVAEQFNSNEPFNKGRLYNIAFKYIKSKYKNNVNCFILHDVDLIPESDYNLYECDNFMHTARHLSLIILKNENYILPDSYKESPYELLVGGVLCIKPNIYKKINGFSNEFWNWGAEDDGNIC